MKKNKLSAFDATDETKDGKKGLYERVIEIKNKNPKLKVLLAVGGWSFGTERFKTMASNKYNRRLFIFSAMDYLRAKNFDGLDLDWEFPAGTDDKRTAVSAGGDTVRSGYDVPAVAAYVDFLNIMSYDFHGKWESKTGHNAPLYALSTESEWRKQLSMESGVKLWEKLGAPKDKIVVGMATYGRSFTLANVNNNGMNAPTAGGGKAGEYTRESGFLSFYEICDLLKEGATYFWDDEQKVPYAVHGDLWVGFDDERSIRIKMKWLLENDYAGAMVWTVDMDDFTGRCAGTKYPLISVMSEELLGKVAARSNLDAIIKKAASRVIMKPANDESNLITKGDKVTTSATENSALTENNYRQTTFVFNTIDYLRKKNFDGLDICWEFPRGAEDKERYTHLIKELREAFEGEAKGSKKQRLLLTAAVPSNFEAIAAGYDVPEINKYLDFMNIMTYDFHGDWEQAVGHNSPLFPLNSASNYQKKLTVDFSVSEWVNRGAAKEKIVVGLPTYGRTFTLANPNLTDIGAPCIKGGLPGQFTRESGFLSFFEICDFLKLGATLVWDNEQMVPYAYKEDQWVGFDDPRSFKIKVQWLKQAGYSGIMIWSVDMDDFTGACMGLAFPLINSAKEELKGYKVANLEAQSSNAIAQNIDDLNCDEADGHISYHKDKKDCTRYYMCEGKRKHHMPCPQNLVFNLKEKVCDWPENVEECSHHIVPK
ncbi:hypothetical protein B4U79_14591 [Dinothrombium tinctorium]|uniref:Uncharacterized protein n=1 Tax=Dinothrombium tinctorium TaxID=1965070 RepID=A0A3S3QR43_9ACAR|nr:hypothetical protein B4U79_14591 [Dinothrombium tinctorium]